jgi:hypothetical protein
LGPCSMQLGLAAVCNIYVRSRRAGERVMASVSRFLTTKLRLRVNEAKSAVTGADLAGSRNAVITAARRTTHTRARARAHLSGMNEPENRQVTG